ncbi:MAG TPA: hypothetical protein VIU62_19250 [Chloroflexota bacterium]
MNECPDPAVEQTTCEFRHVRWSDEEAACPECQHPAPRVWETARSAIDIDLDRPAVLLVEVSVHRCPSCGHFFRAQPPFLRRCASYTNRVVSKAVAAVYTDGMAMTRVTERLARDFWVQPSEAMIRHWCHDYTHGLDFVQDYQPWVVEGFSGVLCVDEVYQKQLALLLAVDPKAPQGDRLVGYQLVHGAVRQADVADFFRRLQAVGIDPDEVITDGSALYPALVSAVWPQAAHQLCLFHQTRQVTRHPGGTRRQVLKTASASLPVLPPQRRDAPSKAAPDAPGPVRGTTATTERRRGRGRCRREVHAAGLALVHALRQQGVSVIGIARRTGISRPTVRSWLREPAPADEVLAAAMAAPPPRLDLVVPPPPPPAPWQDWEQVRQVRQALGPDRFRLLCRPDHLTDADRAAFAAVCASPVGESVRLARTFLEEWYALWRDKTGQRRSFEDAQERHARWQANPDYAGLPPLQRVQKQCDAAQFEHVGAFLRHAEWESTNNGAERTGRAFRHLQAPRFRWRTEEMTEGALVAEALAKGEACRVEPPPAGRCQRGRKPGTLRAPAPAVT